ncbi:RNase H domain-containing protein [Trichonephila clavipes]|uniref:RNase H domain-containing protein n=1 Tax=Trichonephila clavipes TaxID=2585209 RepID=A0A8X6RF17_TRICX|nr:RNase H domain-containing protein [Trichonephila clavipes]
MDDNATCHRTLAVQDCLDSEGIQRLVWPARSPDLNPIENVWDALGRQVAGRNYPPTNKNTLIRALTEEWDKLPQQLLDNVVQTPDWETAHCASQCLVTRGLLATDLELFNHGHVTRTTPELVPPSPNYHTNGRKENLSASSISNYDCILSPFFIPHPSERNAINIVQFSDKITEDFPVICYTDGSKIDGRVGFAFVVFRSGVESENFQFRIRDECTVFVAELLCLNFAVKWITEQNSVISEYLICTDSLSSLDSLKYISSSNNIIVEIQTQLKSLRDKNMSIDFAFVRGHTGVLGNERVDWLAKAATKRKIDIDVNIPKSFSKKITKERMVKSWNQEYLISNKGRITKKFFPTINKRLSCHHFYTNYKLTQFLTGHGNFKSYLN